MPFGCWRRSRAPGKIICVGLNYHDHCREQGIEPPAYPMLFAKFGNAVSNPGGIRCTGRAPRRSSTSSASWRW